MIENCELYKQGVLLKTWSVGLTSNPSQNHMVTQSLFNTAVAVVELGELNQNILTSMEDLVLVRAL